MSSKKLTELAQQLVGACEKYNLIYDPAVLPVKLTADCYIIYATHVSHSCHKHGDCKVEQYYALTGGDTIKIVLNAHDQDLTPS